MPDPLCALGLMVSKRKAKGNDRTRGKDKKVKSEDQAPPSPAVAPGPMDDGNAPPSAEAPPALGAGADAAQALAEAPMVRVGVYSAPLPFDCHCCPDFSSGVQDLVLQHLAERSHHDAHIEFIAANEALAQHEIDALNAFNLYKPPTEPSRAAKLLARITTTAAAAPKDTVLASKNQCLAKIPSSPMAIIGASGPSPSTPTNGNATAGEAKTPPSRGATTRTGSGRLQRVAHGNGNRGDLELAQKLQEREFEGKGSPTKPPSQPQGTPRSKDLPGPTPSTVEVELPWHDYVCDRHLRTEEEARQHFGEPGHIKAVEGFLANHRAKLEATEPESVKLLLSTLPAPPRPPKSLAEQLAQADRESSGPVRDRGEGQAEVAALPQTGPSGSGATGPHKLDKHEREGLGQWLCEFGRERTMPARESNPEERVYMVGVEETRRWHGRFASMPLPAYCTLCNVRLPYYIQAVTHFEGGVHRAKCAAAGDKIMAKAIEDKHSSAAQSDLKVTFKAPTGKPPSRADRYPTAQASVEFPCAGAECRGRVHFPSGDARAAARCNTCNFKQRPPVPASPAKHVSSRN
jgi:hypothetical protein